MGLMVQPLLPLFTWIGIFCATAWRMGTMANMWSLSEACSSDVRQVEQRPFPCP